jgi:N-acetylglucosamine kinase-like BadF-type ATPase
LNVSGDDCGDDLVLGVDGGGTGTTAWLSHKSEPAQPVGRGKSGPSNLRAIGIELTTQNLNAAIQSAFEDAGLQRSVVSGACLSLAGVDRPEDRAQVESWARGQPLASDLVVSNDALSVLYAAEPEGVGIALISGTGSFCLGRDSSGRVIRSGGWGYRLGDEGSAYWIANQALLAIARAVDFRGPETSLTELAARRFQFSQPLELISRIYSPNIGRPEIASFAASVFDSAEQGDVVANRIVDSATVELGELVRSVAGQLRLDRSQLTLACTGGVLLNQPGLVERLMTRVSANCAEDNLQTRIKLVMVTEPVLGAVQMAASAATP